MATDLNGSALCLASEHTARPVTFSRPVGTITALIISDSFALVVSLVLASVLRDYILHSPSASISGTLPPALILVLCTFLSAGLYTGVSLDEVEEVRRLCVSVTVAFLTLLSATFFLHDLSLSRVVYLLAWLLCLVMVPLCRSLTRGRLSSKSWWGSPVAILGHGSTGKLVLQRLQENPGLGLRPFAVLDDDPGKLRDLDGSLVSGPLSECRDIAANHKLAYGIVCMPHISRDELLALLARYGQCFGHLLVIPNLIGMTSLGISARNLGGVVGLEVRQELLRPAARSLKRALDLAITLALAPLVIPLMAVVAFLVTVESRGPVIYKRERIGLGGRTFVIWKIRTMVTDGEHLLQRYLEKHPSERQEWLYSRKLKRDPRVTRIGKILRKTSIDELPQLWNVLVGEMSLVGPRPIQEDEIGMYGPTFSLYKQVRPGITGLWQVSGRSALPFKERVNLDAYVIQNWSVWLDIYVLALTARAVLTADGAY